MPRKYQRARLNRWGLLTLFMLTGSAAGMATALFCAWQMITITYVGPVGSGKTTAIKNAIKELELRGFICRNVGKHMGPPWLGRPSDVLFRETVGPAPLGVEVSPHAPTVIHVAAYNAMMDAGKQIAERKKEAKNTADHSDEMLLIKKVSPSLFHLIDTAKLDSEIALAIGRIIGAAREQGRKDATPARPALPQGVNFPGHLVWNPNGPHRPGYVHFNRASADTEAQRLANGHPGEEFFVMAPVAVARAKRVVQSAELEPMPQMRASFDLDDEIPF